MLTSLVVLQHVNVKKSEKLAKIPIIDEENLLNDMMNFNEIFRENVTYDIIKSQKNDAFTLSLENTI